jgi:hypothetical protein
MARWLWHGAALVLVACMLGACASAGAPDDSDQRQHDHRRDSPFYVPFSA